MHNSWHNIWSDHMTTHKFIVYMSSKQCTTFFDVFRVNSNRQTSVFCFGLGSSNVSWLTAVGKSINGVIAIVGLGGVLQQIPHFCKHSSWVFNPKTIPSFHFSFFLFLLPSFLISLLLFFLPPSFCPSFFPSFPPSLPSYLPSFFPSFLCSHQS